MNCEVAREALSARLDGEREPVPSARVDEHLAQCAECRSWFAEVDAQAAALRRLAQPRAVVEVTRPPARVRRVGAWPRWALAAVGVAQLAVAAIQGLGVATGLGHVHDAGHVLNESTAWSIGLGVAMLGAARWPRAAQGVAVVCAAFVAVLIVYEITDAVAGHVTVERMLTHVPVLLGTVLALLVWRRESSGPPAPDEQQSDDPITLPPNASHGRRRGHLWPTDGSAA